MLNRIIRFSLDNRLVVVIAAVLVAVTGVWTASRMEVDVFPDLNAPTVVVMTEAQGMAAEEVERLVTFPIETSLNGATDVRRVRSQSTTGFSVVWVEFDWNTDIYIARQIVSERLASVAEQLPPTAGQPTLGPQSSILGEMMIVGLTSDGTTSLEELRTLADWTLRPRLLSVAGVAQVAVIGGDIREYQILLSPEKMDAYGITLDEVLAAAQEMNRNSSGGVLYEYGNEYIVRGMASTTDTEKIAAGLVRMTAQGEPVTFGDIAEVRTGAKSPQLGVASVQGEPAVLVTVTKQPYTSTIDLTETLDETIAELSAAFPADVKVSTDIFRQSRFIDSSINNIKNSLLEGAFFVVLVLLVFLMNGRVTLISLTAMPLSLLITVIVMRLTGHTINTMSLGGMAIAIGSLVDDAIIDVENVYKRLRENYARPKEQREACLKVVYEASREIRVSIVNATFITIVAFVPLFFLGGMEGRMLKPLGIAFIISLLASLLVAVTLTPVMSSYMLTSERALRRSQKEPPVTRFFQRIYRAALLWVLGHRNAVLAGVITLFIGAAVVFSTFGSSFLPPFNEGSLTINVATMPGVSLEESDRMGRMVEKILLEIPEIRTVARKTGRAELDEHALGVNASEIEAPFVLDKRSREEFLADVRHRLGDLRGLTVEVGQPISHRIDAMLSGTKANIAIKLFGEDLNQMYTLATQISKSIAGVKGIADISVEQQVERSQLKITPRREMLALYGVTMPEFNEYITTALAGQAVSQVYEGNNTFDLTVKVADDRRNTIEKIGNLLIDGNGAKVPLSYLADIESSSGPNTVSRENVKRKIVVSANVVGGDLGGAVEAIRKAVERDIALPEGYYVEYGGQFESQQSASRTLLFASLLAILVVFMLLFQEFKSVPLSTMIMVNLPFALVGGVASIWITSGVVSIPSIIGFISLFGISVRNGILLVSRYNQLRAEGDSLQDAVVHGSLDRLTPILMTSLTTALALIPLAVNGDVSGNEIQSPMAQVILGGLVSSTLLNGFVMPIMYMLFTSRAERRKRRHAEGESVTDKCSRHE
jgi:CzcA family heavy metal efflux pump